MRIIALLIVLFCGWGCQSTEPMHPFMGDWLWQESYSWGCFGGYKSVAKPGERSILRFTAPDRYQVIRNDSLKEAGIFRLEKDKDSDRGQKVLKMVFSPEPPYAQTNVSLLRSQIITELTSTRLEYGYTFGTSFGGTIYIRER